MTWRTNVLVLANQTASSDDLLGALRRMADAQPARFTLIVPASPREGAAEVLDEALRRLREVGLEAEGQLGDGDPCVAITEAYDPRQHDQIVVCTLPLGSSKWLHAGLPERIAKLTDAQVTHVVARARPPEPQVQAAPAHRRSLGPLLEPYSALGHTATPAAIGPRRSLE